MKRREFITGVGSAAALPVMTRAQQASMPQVGVLVTGPDDARIMQPLLAAFHEGLNERGYREGRNVALLYRWAENQFARMPSLAADLAARPVAVIVTMGGLASAMAARTATRTIPIVFQLGSDPVTVGLVPNLSRPGGNVTGVTFLTSQVSAKRLQLLSEITPPSQPVALLFNPGDPDKGVITEIETAARALGRRLVTLYASDETEIEQAFEALKRQRVGALLVAADALFYVQRNQLVALAARDALPTIYHVRETVEVGGLMSYGGNIREAYRIAGNYVSRILQGENPGDLPVQQVTRVEFVINLKTARQLGLTIPLALLGRADEVIE
jgi:putative ABC transport system substrate-binding protein